VKMSASITEGIKYPWAKPKRLLNILWILLPIFGWLFLAGYTKKILATLAKGNNKEFPAADEFLEGMKQGFMFFIRVIPLYIVLIIAMLVPILGLLTVTLFSMFLLPWLIINLAVKDTVKSTFEFGTALKVVTGNIGEYIVVLLKTIVYSIVYFALSLVLVGIPGYVFGSTYYLAEFYAKRK